MPTTKQPQSDPMWMDTEINRLVRETNDPVQRAMLLVMMGMSTNLIRNTELTMQVHTEFSDHREDVVTYMKNGNALLNRGIGAWKVVAWIGGGAWTVMLAMGLWFFSEVRDHGSRLATVEIRLEDVRESLKDHLRQANPLMRDLQRERGISEVGPK